MENYFSSPWDNVTTLHPLALVMLVIAVISTLTVPRRYAMLPIIAISCTVPAGQRVVIAGMDFHFLRLLTVVGLMRLMIRGEARPLRWTYLDYTVAAWVLLRLMLFTMRNRSVGALINQLGEALDGLGLYFLFRYLIRDWRDFDALIRSFMIVSIPMAMFFIYEAVAQRNPFYIFGQALEEAIVRDGRVRTKGAFSHQILAGCYFVGLVPLIIGRLWNRRSSRTFTIVGLVAAVTPIVTSSSSTPIFGVAFAVLAFTVYPLRYEMKWVRRGIVFCLLLIQAMMSKPIYHLIHRAGSLGLGASTSYHRYRLIDAFVREFPSWAVWGTRSTAGWGFHLVDVTNHFILQAVKGGLPTFLAFLATYIMAFKQLGSIIQSCRGNRTLTVYAWSMGSSVVAHAAMMNATSYFGQILVVWFALFASIASLTPHPRRVRATRQRAQSSKTGAVGTVPPGTGSPLAGAAGRSQKALNI